MAEEDDSQKTEDPSGRKLGKLREQGQVPSSQEVKNWIILFGATASLMFLGPHIAADMRDLGQGYLANAYKIETSVSSFPTLMGSALIEIGKSLSLLVIFMIFLSLIGNIGQFGLLFAPAKIMPQLNKISPLTGFKRLFSLPSLIEFVKGIFKIVLVGAAAFGVSIPFLQDIELLPALPVSEGLSRLNEIAIVMAIATVGLMTVIALADYLFQQYHFTKTNRQSKQELKEEQKQAEGDPLIKARMRQLRAERLRQNLSQAVPQASAVVTNPTHFAVALKYEMHEMPAPVVVAKGMDYLALQIREIAEEHDIPIVENPPLARALYDGVDVDEEIPPEHFKAVAEVIGYVMRLRGRL